MFGGSVLGGLLAVQVTIVVAQSIALFGVPGLGYLLAYAIGTQRPATYGRQDAEAPRRATTIPSTRPASR